MGGAIRARNVTKRFNSFTAVDRLDLTVERGEVFGFLGHNGAGKSTTINMLLDFIRPTEGSIEVFGHETRTNSVKARRRMGVLPEGYSVFSGLTGRQHVQFAMDAKGVDGEPLDLLDRVGITEAADRNAEGYSKGMAQRLVLAMALVGEPDLLILDEPTSGLDPAGAKAMREIILEENERGATVFFSSHILEQIEAVADRVGIMHEGQLEAVDTIDGLREMAGGETKLVVTLDESTVPDPETVQAAGGASTETESVEADVSSYVTVIQGIDGVQNAWVEDDGQYGITCAKEDKMDILVELNNSGVDVLDFTTDEPSLEELFVEYTRRSE
jgi:ABC-2 type transport system ATP-binding protein